MIVRGDLEHELEKEIEHEEVRMDACRNNSFEFTNRRTGGGRFLCAGMGYCTVKGSHMYYNHGNAGHGFRLYHYVEAFVLRRLLYCRVALWGA